MAAFSEALLKGLATVDEEVKKINDEEEAVVRSKQAEFRKQVGGLLQERQKILDAEPNFWAKALSDEQSIIEIRNGTTDPRALRAVKTFAVETNVTDDGAIRRRVRMTLQSNIFVESAELCRVVDDELNTVECSGIKWKSGTEKSKSDSILRFFDSAVDDKEVIGEILDAFEVVYQNPFNASP